MTSPGSTSELRVQFAHGLESSPKGRKAVYLAKHFTALTPEMDTSDFEGCVSIHEKAIESFRPHVLVGSSFGGAVAVALLRRGSWCGPTLLLAPATEHFGVEPVLPEGVRVAIVHGIRDDVVPLQGSELLARSGSRDLVELTVVDDGHRLDSLIDEHRLSSWVEKLARG